MEQGPVLMRELRVCMQVTTHGRIFVDSVLKGSDILNYLPGVLAQLLGRPSTWIIVLRATGPHNCSPAEHKHRLHGNAEPSGVCRQ